jgi:hypothetical protein
MRRRLYAGLVAHPETVPNEILTVAITADAIPGTDIDEFPSNRLSPEHLVCQVAAAGVLSLGVLRNHSHISGES